MSRRRVLVATCALIGVLAGVLTGCRSTTTVRITGERVPAAGSVSSSAQPVAAARVSTSATPSISATRSTSLPPRPKPDACAHNRAGQLVKVSLRAQRMWLCDRRTVAFSAPVTSGIVGRYTSTPTGRYTIQALDRHQTLTLLDGSQFTVDYWIPFDAPLFGFHDSPWQHFPYGSPKYRTRGSHGCVHLPHAAIAHLYRWAHVGTPVHINA